jgi:hypothetical protein
MKVFAIKFFVLLTLVFANINWSYGQQKLISIAYENEKIDAILLDIATEYQYDILFHPNYFKDHPLVTIRQENAPIQAILSELLKDAKVDFRLKDGLIQLIKLQTIYGYIRDELTHEGLINATVYHPALQKGTYTNEYGYFSLSLPYETKKLTVQYIGYQAKEIALAPKNNKAITVFLKSSIELEEVIITKEIGNSFNYSNQEVDGQDILPNQLKAFLSSGGEPDINQHLIKQAGVSSGPDGLGGLHVRGGNSDQNLILLDGVRVFQPNHFFGLFSIFNTPLLKNAKFGKYDFHPKYARGISSVLDVTLKEGSTKKWNGNISASTLATQVHVNGPLKKDKTSILFSLRRSHIDDIIKNRTAAKKLEEKDENGQINLFFYDMHLKMQHILGANDKLYVSHYYGKDHFRDQGAYDFSLNDDTQFFANFDNTLDWFNQTSALKWNHLFGDKLFSSAILSYSHFKYKSQAYTLQSFLENSGLRENNTEQANLLSNNRELGLRYDIEHYPTDQVQNSFGISFHQTDFIPGGLQNLFSSEIDSMDMVDVLEEDLVEDKAYDQKHFMLYWNRKMQFHPKFSLTVGGRYGWVYSKNILEKRSSNFHLWHARLVFSYLVHPKVLLRLSGSKNDQALHLLTSSDIGFPSDIWVPAIGPIKPQTAWHGNLFFRYRPHANFTLSSSIFYKKMENLYRYPNTISLPSIRDNSSSFWEKELVQGKGMAKGWELEIVYKSKKIEANLSYTLSDYQRVFDKIENGRQFPFTFNQRHNLSLNAHYKLREYLTFYANFIFNNGNNQTLYSSKYYYSPLDFLNPEIDAQDTPINGDRLPAYHRLDLGLALSFEKKLKHELTLGVQNVYNRANVYFRYNLISLDEEDNANGKELERAIALPILPVIRYSLSF